MIKLANSLLLSFKYKIFKLKIKIKCLAEVER